MVGAVGFIVASGMLTLETQRDWWRPEPLDIGWHVAFWNLVVRRAAARALALFRRGLVQFRHVFCIVHMHAWVKPSSMIL